MLPSFGFDCAHQHGHNNEGKHANHHCQIPDDIPEVLLSQSLVQSVRCSCHITPPVVKVMTQSTGQGLLQVKGHVGPIRCTHLVGGKTKDSFLGVWYLLGYNYRILDASSILQLYKRQRGNSRLKSRFSSKSFQQTPMRILNSDFFLK